MQEGTKDEAGNYKEGTIGWQNAKIAGDQASIRALATGTKNEDGTYTGGLNESIGGLRTATGNVRDIAGSFKTIGEGTADPRFAAYQKAQEEAMGRAHAGQQRLQSEMFGRRGLGSSSAALNAQNNLAGDFGNQRKMLAAQLGMQQMGRQDQALAQAAGLYGQQGNMLGQQAGLFGQQAGLYGASAGMQQQQLQNLMAGYDQRNAAEGQSLGAIQSGMTNLLAPEAIDIARTAAENAGTVNTGGGGKK